ncbi:MAG: hypothetical protein NT013_25215 [Planctomycetia bacterium]|nr:hypothetical protein [Planctomycetia bacterium]
MNALQPTSIRVTFCAVLLAILLSGWSLAQDANKTVPPPFVPKITIDKETTWVTEPLKANGTIDYHAMINRYYSRGVTTENNSVVLLYRAMGPKPGGGRLPNGFFEALGIEAPREEGDDLNRERFLGDDVLYSRPWTTEEFPADAAWLRSVEKPLDLVVEATRRREYFSPMVSDGADDPLFATLLPGVQETRWLARTLVSRAMWRLGEEQRFEAWADLIAVHRLGRLMSRDSCFVGWLVGSAIEKLAIDAELRFLAETQSTVRHLKFCRRDLQKLPRRVSLYEKIDVGERASALDSCQRIACGTMTLSECWSLVDGEQAFLTKLFAIPMLDQYLSQSADWNVIMKSFNLRHDQVLAIGKLPTYRQREAAFQTLDQELKQRIRRRTDPVAWLNLIDNQKALSEFTGDLFIPATITSIAHAFRSEAHVEQNFQNVETALALAAWHSEHGDYPRSLADLVPKYLAEPPQDLFTNQPLHYERLEEGYRFYSFGFNEKDDGGRGNFDQPEEDDIVVRMPLQPPQPK